MPHVEKGLVLALALLVLVGCGKRGGEKTYRVTGTVTFQGKPVEEAAVSFISEKGRPAVGKTDAAGAFELSTFNPGDGAIAGEHKVVIVPFSDEITPLSGDPGYSEAQKKEKQRLSTLPAKYADPNQTPLKATVEPGGENEFTFDMQ